GGSIAIGGGRRKLHGRLGRGGSGGRHGRRRGRGRRRRAVGGTPADLGGVGRGLPRGPALRQRRTAEFVHRRPEIADGRTEVAHGRTEITYRGAERQSRPVGVAILRVFLGNHTNPLPGNTRVGRPLPTAPPVESSRSVLER